jgi:hypothetical protein
MSSKIKNLTHILSCEGTKIWREGVLDKGSGILMQKQVLGER